ncbi:methyltransferase domain-containing protein [Streptomyces sp. NPDC059037]|uniref:methyltransferase domain-containing protein n=1 Tax=Streptomyces sp. NPDC059037 TaxID=3346710 RepID=UPI003694EDD7
MTTTPWPPALDQAFRLLTDQRSVPCVTGGYLDLADGRVPASTGFAQALMRTRALPVIYEDWWRPFLGWVFKGGPSGPDMTEEHHMARRLLGVRPGSTVLDVGCGPGNFTREFGRGAGADGLAVGLDSSPSMLAKAVRETHRGNVAYTCADATALPFRDGSFDAVCCFAALNMFAEPFVALDDMIRVLAPGGRIALLTSCRPAGTLGRVAGELMTRGSGMHMFGPHELVGALRARGLTDVDQRIAGLTQFVWGRQSRDTCREPFAA